MITGAGLADDSLLSSIPSWFDKRVNLAAGLSLSGASVGTFIGPFFILFFSELYGMHSAFIMIAAFWMQIFILGALQRPGPEKIEPQGENITKEITDNYEKSEIIWTSDNSGVSTINITNQQEYVDVDIKSRCNEHVYEEKSSIKNKTHRPSYLVLLRRPRVIRVLIIITCGYGGSLGKFKGAFFGLISKLKSFP